MIMLVRDKITSSIIKYKNQKICNIDGEILGWEVLIDSTEILGEVAEVARNEIICNVEYSLSLLKRIVFNLASSRHERNKLRNKSLFINCDIVDLDNSVFIKKLLSVRDMLSTMQIELVVEITERKNKLLDKSALFNLSVLKSRGLIFAADDYDINGSDFRSCLVKFGLFDFVKVECDDYDEKKLTELRVSSQGAKFIIERVETKKQFDELSKWSGVYGLQGYYFGEENSAGI